jgi:hypothetical protein
MLRLNADFLLSRLSRLALSVSLWSENPFEFQLFFQVAVMTGHNKPFDRLKSAASHTASDVVDKAGFITGFSRDRDRACAIHS